MPTTATGAFDEQSALREQIEKVRPDLKGKLTTESLRPNLRHKALRQVFTSSFGVAIALSSYIITETLGDVSIGDFSGQKIVAGFAVVCLLMSAANLLLAACLYWRSRSVELNWQEVEATLPENVILSAKEAVYRNRYR